MAVLLASHFRYQVIESRDPCNDRLIFSKGHAAPLLYAMWKAAGAISDQELLTLRKRGSRMEGHPSPALPWVDVATGSLGQGLPVAVGMALATERGTTRGARGSRFWVLLGDSEMAEGSVYEALEMGGFYSLRRVIGILDMNRLGQRGPTMLRWDGDAYAERARSFGWEAQVIDGHDLAAIDGAYAAAEQATRPTLIIARTKKGAGVSFLEDKEGWHGRALDGEQARAALAELGAQSERPLVVAPLAPARAPSAVSLPQPPDAKSPILRLPAYDVGTSMATRAAFGEALVAIGSADARVVVLDGEVCNSTYTERFARHHPDRFFEMYIAEQQMVSAAVGMQALGLTPFAATFAAFFTRAFDQVRMASISLATLHLVGSHAGVSIGEDGPSQMGLEDLAMMRAVNGSTVLYPSCANATARLALEMSRRRGLHYLRVTREKTPVLYSPEERFPVGGSKVLRRSGHDAVAIVAAGITVHEALRAYDKLVGRGIAARIIDAYSVKPIDAATLKEAAHDCSRGLVVVEDHHPEGGLADAVAGAFDRGPGPSIVRLAVRHTPASASPEEQLEDAGIDARAIVEAAEGMVKAA
jgi:transketolase